ncbi:MAG: RNA polymerase sigma-70 factor [Salinivirgaceae bacterium]|nr:RNA polymerase sigma-70 factor [Salinivirgaceae bacterium]
MTEAQFELLFRKYFTVLSNVAYSVVKDRDEARDITQQVFIKFWDKRDDVNIQDNIKSYLHRAVINTSLNFIEKNKKIQLEEDIQTVFKEELYTSNKPEFEEGEVQNAIEKAIKNLPEKCQLVFSLSRYEGMTNKEIAEYLEVSLKAVEKHISRALRELREKLKPYMNLFAFFIFFKVGGELVYLLLQ